MVSFPVPKIGQPDPWMEHLRARVAEEVHTFTTAPHLLAVPNHTHLGGFSPLGMTFNSLLLSSHRFVRMGNQESAIRVILAGLAQLADLDWDTYGAYVTSACRECLFLHEVSARYVCAIIAAFPPRVWTSKDFVSRLLTNSVSNACIYDPLKNYDATPLQAILNRTQYPGKDACVVMEKMRHQTERPTLHRSVMDHRAFASVCPDDIAAYFEETSPSKQEQFVLLRRYSIRPAWSMVVSTTIRPLVMIRFRRLCIGLGRFAMVAKRYREAYYDPDTGNAAKNLKREFDAANALLFENSAESGPARQSEK